ncbi:MAG: hypothetical protein SCALA701_18520 [Candidatus Scalindua sp.]|nr:MAG: hypothetical protein SCALA701_18520 [Candidatus Scalindua sp.]
MYAKNFLKTEGQILLPPLIIRQTAYLKKESICYSIQLLHILTTNMSCLIADVNMIFSAGRDIMSKISQKEINDTAWVACDTFRSVVDPDQYKDYILVMLFLKYISDVWRGHYEKYKKQYDNNEERIRRKLERERFVLPIVKMKETDTGTITDSFLAGYYRLYVIGNTYIYLIERFGSDAGKKAGEFYTPHQVSKLLAALASTKAGDRTYDPSCGSGGLLIEAARKVGEKNFALFGEEVNGSTWALKMLRMILTGVLYVEFRRRAKATGHLS